MSMRPILLLSSACMLAMFLSVWTFAAGYGLIAAFLVYSLGGSALVIAFAAVSFIKMPFHNEANEDRATPSYERFATASNSLEAA